jgi:hypothetical protein
MLKRFIHRRRELFEKDYVYVSLDQRWENSAEIAKSLKPDKKPRGIPWSAILGSEGKMLATSDGLGGNIGFPSQPKEIDHFISMLESTAVRMTEAEREKLRADLLKK